MASRCARRVVRPACQSLSSVSSSAASKNTASSSSGCVRLLLPAEPSPAVSILAMPSHRGHHRLSNSGSLVRPHRYHQRRSSLPGPPARLPVRGRSGYFPAQMHQQSHTCAMHPQPCTTGVRPSTLARPCDSSNDQATLSDQLCGPSWITTLSARLRPGTLRSPSAGETLALWSGFPSHDPPRRW